MLNGMLYDEDCYFTEKAKAFTNEGTVWDAEKLLTIKQIEFFHDNIVYVMIDL